MQIVIDIPEEEYNTRQLVHYFGCYSDKLDLVIYNGTPLDKIRERINLEKLGYPPSAGYYKAIVKVLQIIDKYKAESEE